jgi:2-keto-4-pentenoate hydratase/2-oxohepta-3-ene-1,7-dioic acid hydratase in catechol pathway
MRLVSFDGGFGSLEGDRVVPLGDDLVAHLAGEPPTRGDPVPVDQLRLRAPVPAPGKIVAVGLNYRDHAAEAGLELPEEPTLFAKFANSVIGPGDPIVVPPLTTKPDYEAELGVVIGRRTRGVAAADALGYVAGYTCVNDVTARDLQGRTSQWTRGKAIDTFLPCGPSLVTPDELPDPQRLAIRCLIGDEVLQDSRTDQMVWGVAELISFISQTMTLEPGDLIATGTPAGVGFARTPRRYLQHGDQVTVEIDTIGRLTNPVQRQSS